MKQTTSVISVRTFVAVSLALVGIVADARGDTYNFLGSATNSWISYEGATSAPILNTATPGSIADNTALSGSSWGRLNTAFSAYPASQWRTGDTFAFHFDGVVASGTTFQAEFSNGAAAAPHFGLRLTLNNSASSGADLVQFNPLGGTAVVLFLGNFGGAGGVGAAQHLVANLTLSILGTSSASLNGSVSDDLGTLWSAPNTAISLGTAPSVLYSGINVNASGSVSGVNALDWTLTPVPEPGTAVLFGGLGLSALLFGRRLRRNS
jgi:hypothetical protein